MFTRSIAIVVVAAAFVLLPAVALAQATLSGIVRDTSGAVLPGVTVEAASPVLLEKVRTAASDGSGQYRIAELLPGTYTVTFSLAGFTTVQRQDVELSGVGVTTINVEMRVGALEETITVTGASPVVDTTNVRTQTVVSREELDALPLAKSFMGYNSIIPGLAGGTTEPGSRDVGGLTGESPVMPFIHGGDPGLASMDGIVSLAAEARAVTVEGGIRYGQLAPALDAKGFALHNLADTLAEQGRGVEAEAAYRESIARKVEAFGEASHEVAASLNNLAVLLADLARKEEARAAIARAVAIADAVLAPAHPIAVACRATAASFD